MRPISISVRSLMPLSFIASCTMVAAFLVEAAQDAVAAQHQVDVGAEAVEDAGEFDGDVAAADDDDALGQFAAGGTLRWR